MMEIAICLAIIGIALVAIIGVLPIGMNVQQDNRQQTVIAQDASVLMDAIRNGQLGYDDLTNYVYAITNYWVEFNPITTSGANNISGVNGYTYSTFYVNPQYAVPNVPNGAQLTNGANIIGLMSTPEFTDLNGNPIASILNGGYSNHVVAYVYSMSGLAVEKPPQDNPIMQQDSFGYRVFVVNAPIGVGTNDYWPGNTPPVYEQQLANNLHELRLTFLWPQLPNGNLGAGRQTFRTMIAGQIGRQPPLTPFNSSSSVWCNTNFYCYQPQLFTNALLPTQ